jgi:hypothetical protein
VSDKEEKGKESGVWDRRGKRKGSDAGVGHWHKKLRYRPEINK